MSLFLIFCWILGVTSFTLLGSLYVRRYDRPDLLIGLYVAFVLTSQLLATKTAVFDLGVFGQISGPAGILVFSVTFLLLDIVNERFGRRVTQRMIFIAFIAQLAPLFFVWLGTQLESSAPVLGDTPALSNAIMGVSRVTVAAWLSFLISESLDAYIYAWFKQRTGDKHLWMRNVFSTIPALVVDSVIFIPIAYWGTPLLSLIVLFKGQVIIKWIVGVTNIPFIYLNHAVFARGRNTPDRTIWEFRGDLPE